MFDILGGFVVKFLPAESHDQLRTALSDLAFDCVKFDCVKLDGARIEGKASLHEALFHAMNFAAFWSKPTNNWDSLSDLLWQWVMGEAGHQITKLAFVIENGSSLLARDPDLVFQFAEICLHLQAIVSQARVEEREAPLQVRVFLVG